MEEIHITSAIKLIIGGVAMLLIMVNNQKKEINGIEDKNPFLKTILRENLRKYRALPPKNIIEDLSPCAIINIKAPATPI